MIIPDYTILIWDDVILETVKRYKTIFVDWAGTLSNSKFWGHWENPSHAQHPIFKQTQEFIVHPSSFVRDWMRGNHTTEEFVQYVAKEIGHDFTELFDEFVISSRNLQFVSKDVLDLIKTHRSYDTQVVIATDNMDYFPRWVIPTLKLESHFDAILNSYNLKVLKSDTDTDGKSLFFKDYIKRHAILEGESVLIDDSDITSIAKTTGMHFLHITPTKNIIFHLRNLLLA